MTDNELQRLEVLWLALFWGSVIGPPVLFFCLAKVWKHLPQTVYWIATPILVWLLLMSIQSGIGSPIGHENARRAGDTMYDGTGASAAIFILGIPIGFLSTAIIYALGTALRKVRQLMKNDAEPGVRLT
jgi:hypothetical protein